MVTELEWNFRLAETYLFPLIDRSDTFPEKFPTRGLSPSLWSTGAVILECSRMAKFHLNMERKGHRAQKELQTNEELMGLHFRGSPGGREGRREFKLWGHQRLLHERFCCCGWVFVCFNRPRRTHFDTLDWEFQLCTKDAWTQEARTFHLPSSHVRDWTGIIVSTMLVVRV